MTASASSRLEHMISVDQVDAELLTAILDRADQLAGQHQPTRQGRILVSLFYEPSTRTRLSFETAMLRLGGAVIGSEAAGHFSSATKGETLEDSVQVVATYGDVVVLRHHQVGAAARAAAVSSVPVINAGDGSGEHPTQALLDAYTIRRELGRLRDLHIAVCGDLRHSRTVRSLTRLLALFPGIRLTLVAPDVLQATVEQVAALRALGITVALSDNLRVAVRDADVLYHNRVQRERFTDADELARAMGGVRVGPDVVEAMPEHAIVMDPLPRVDEIDVSVDRDRRAAYFRQAANGVPLRMAVIEHLLG